MGSKLAADVPARRQYIGYLLIEQAPQWYGIVAAFAKEGRVSFSPIGRVYVDWVSTG
jgi:hypothetical protein